MSDWGQVGSDGVLKDFYHFYSHVNPSEFPFNISQESAIKVWLSWEGGTIATGTWSHTFTTVSLRKFQLPIFNSWTTWVLLEINSKWGSLDANRTLGGKQNYYENTQSPSNPTRLPGDSVAKTEDYWPVVDGVAWQPTSNYSIRKRKVSKTHTQTHTRALFVSFSMTLNLLLTLSYSLSL